MRAGLLLAAMCALLPGWRVSAQEPQAERPVFRSGVNLVRLDVRVLDDKGKPVPDLRQDELLISEGDVTRPVVLFQRVAGSGRSYVESAQRTIASDISTNQGAPQGQLFVLIFDQDHIRSGGEQPVRAAADAFLRERVRPQDRVAIYGLPGPGPAQPFTANVNLARQQLSAVRGGLVRSVNGAVTEMTVAEAYEIMRGNEMVLARYSTTDALATANGGGSTAQEIARRQTEDANVLRRLIRENAQTIAARADEESRRFLRSTADVLRSFRGIDGRKTVLLFSEGFYGDNVSREIEEVASAAAETYSVIYAFDLNRRIDLAGAAAPSSDDAMEIASRLEPLGSLAVETSGDLLKDASSRIESALGTFLPDDGSYYLVGFEPALLESGDLQYRRIRVKATRPGVRVVTRTGYARGVQPTGADRRRAIDTALGAPFTQQGLKLEYTTYVGPSLSPGQQRVAVSLRAELPVAASGGPTGGESGAADIVFVVRDSRTGRIAASGSDRLALPARADGGFSTGFSPWRVAFDLPAGDYIMRFVVREPGGIVGSADRRFTVRALGGPDIATSDLLLLSPGDPLPVRARAYTGGTLSGTTRLFARVPDTLHAATARIEITPVSVDDATPTGRASDGVLGDLVSNGTGASRDVMFSVPLEGLTPGSYVARALIRMQGEVVADLRRPVDIAAGAPPPAPERSDRPRDVLDGDIAKRLIRQAARANASAAARRAAADADRGEWATVMAALDAASLDDADASALRGLALIAREEYRGAAALLGLTFDAHPDDPALAFVLGWARLGASDATAAVTAFRNAALLEPTMVAAHLALAETYVSLGHRALAVQALESGLRAIPGAVELQRKLEDVKKTGR